MRIVITVLCLFVFNGCSTVSDYNQGCSDGIELFKKGDKADREDLCNMLELKRKIEKESKR